MRTRTSPVSITGRATVSTVVGRVRPLTATSTGGATVGTLVHALPFRRFLVGGQTVQPLFADEPTEQPQQPRIVKVAPRTLPVLVHKIYGNSTVTAEIETNDWVDGAIEQLLALDLLIPA